MKMDVQGSSKVLRTALSDCRAKHGAKFVVFAGYEMPIQYPLGVMRERIHKGRAVNLRRSNGHSCARHRVEHPRRHGNNNTGRALGFQESADRSVLHTANADRAAKIWMPSAMNFYFLPDMGRMNG